MNAISMGFFKNNYLMQIHGVFYLYMLKRLVT